MFTRYPSILVLPPRRSDWASKATANCVWINYPSRWIKETNNTTRQWLSSPFTWSQTLLTVLYLFSLQCSFPSWLFLFFPLISLITHQTNWFAAVNQPANNHFNLTIFSLFFCQQVWFQNARAKWRRMVLKQEGKSDKCGGVDGGSLNDLELYGNSAGSGGPPMSPQFMMGGVHSPASLGSLDCAWFRTCLTKLWWKCCFVRKIMWVRDYCGIVVIPLRLSNNHSPRTCKKKKNNEINDVVNIYSVLGNCL